MRRSNRVPYYVLALVVLLSLLSFSVVAAQEDVPTDDEVNAIAKQLYCPVCENVPLDVCGTQACAQWRELIREMLAEGKTEADIKEYFSIQYGARVLAEPPAEGLNWLVYIVPPAAFLGGVIILYSGFRTWRKIASENELDEPINTETPTDDPYMARLEEELRKR
jgi:cytochrome c-type biogenesis protein CcmH